MAAVDPPKPTRSAGCAGAAGGRPALGAAAFSTGSRVVAVRPLSSAWLANHAVDVADAAGGVHRVVLRRWARPGWDFEDADFTAAREAAILQLLAPTPVPAPALVAADPGAAVCDVPALLLGRLPGGPPDLGADPGRLVEGLAEGLPPIHAVAGAGARAVPAYRRFYEPGRLDPPAWSARSGCGGGRSRWRPGRHPTTTPASSTVTTTRPTPCGRTAAWSGWSTGPAGRGGRRRSTWATCGSTWPGPSGWRSPTGSWPPTGP